MATRRKKKTSVAASSGNKRSRKSLDLAAGFDDDDEHIESSEDEHDNTPSFQEESESEEENLDVKKVRLAREYLEKIDAVDDDDSSDEDDEDDDEQDAVSRKLQRERLKREGALERDYADKLQHEVTALQKLVIDARPAILSAEQSAAAWVDAGYVTLLHGHDLTPTCVALTGDSTKAVSGSKDHSVLVWDVHTHTKVATLCAHWKKTKNTTNRTAGQVLAVACSDDGKYVAVGKRDAVVSIYDIRAGKNGLVKTFAGHKGAVTCLAFRSQSNQLFSGSEDRCIRHYNLDEMLYLETLYGHQFGVTDIDCHRRERPVSVARDRTARAWKLAEDAHLIFRGGSKVQSADAVTCIKDDWFVTGHEDGVVSLWMMEKKRAAASVVQAHGVNAASGLGRGIVSISSIKGSDLLTTGSSDGYLRFWKTTTGKSAKERGIEAVGQIPVHGFINDIAFSSKAKFCVAAVGQEHRCGRWERVPRAKNRLAIIQLQAPEAATANLDFESLD
jgi:ribosomal RNA-processing protein 9